MMLVDSYICHIVEHLVEPQPSQEVPQQSHVPPQSLQGAPPPLNSNNSSEVVENGT